MSIITSPAEVASAPTKYFVHSLPAGDGVGLALHSWLPADSSRISAVLYYIHGIQSHAGWLLETAQTLVRYGIAVYALDRRGSGRSGGTPGDLPSAEIVTEDYLLGLKETQSRHPELPITVLGQSFGGSILAALASRGLTNVDQLIYCTPALGQQRARDRDGQLNEVRELVGLDYFCLGLADEDYTEKSRYLEFMANDHLMLRQITQRSRATMVAIEDSYWGKKATGPLLPVHFVTVDHDPIINLTAAREVIEDLHAEVSITNFASATHYLEFSDQRVSYWHWLADLITPTAAKPGSEQAGQ